MKKIFIIFLCSFITYNVSAQDEIIGVFPGSIGASFYKGERYTDFDLSFYYLSFENEDTGLGITWIPVNYKHTLNKNYWSFINLQAHHNILFFTYSEKSSLGPFAAINYAPNCKFDNYIFSYGIRYNFSAEFFNTKMYGFNLECGYRTTKDIKNGFYFNVGIDFVWVIAVVAAPFM
jgi:hypothetical protein